MKKDDLVYVVIFVHKTFKQNEKGEPEGIDLIHTAEFLMKVDQINLLLRIIRSGIFGDYEEIKTED